MEVKLVIVRKNTPEMNHKDGEFTLISATSNKDDYSTFQLKEETFIWKRLHTSLPAAKAAMTKMKKKYRNTNNKYYIGTITWSETDGEE